MTRILAVSVFWGENGEEEKLGDEEGKGRSWMMATSDFGV